jgi:hypothetical protein
MLKRLIEDEPRDVFVYDPEVPVLRQEGRRR